MVKKNIRTFGFFVFLILLAVPTVQAIAKNLTFSVRGQGGNLREIKNGGTYSHGRGIIAFGTVSYNTYVNLSATLISKRAAYMHAYAQAQEEELLSNLVYDGQAATASG